MEKFKSLIARPGEQVSLKKLQWMDHFYHNGIEYSKTGLRLDNKIGVFDLNYQLSFIDKLEKVTYIGMDARLKIQIEK